MSAKKPSQYSQWEVNVWLNAIGLGSKIPAFQENAVDGALLVTLTPEDLRVDLGLSEMDIQRFDQAMRFANSLGGGGGSYGGSDAATIVALNEENAKLKAEILDLQEIVKILQEPSNGGRPAPPVTTNQPSYVQSPSYTPAAPSASTYDPYAAYNTTSAAAPSSNAYAAPVPAPAPATYAYAPASAAYAPAPAHTTSYSSHHQPVGAPVIKGAAGGAAVSYYHPKFAAWYSSIVVILLNRACFSPNQN